MKRSRIQDYIISYDKLVLACYLLLCMIGVFVMLDITSIQGSMGFFYRHVIILSGSVMIAMLILYFFKPDKLRPLTPWLLYGTIALLIFVLIKGNTVKGATRQLSLGFISLQPSFLARVALVFFFAGYMDRKHEILITATPKEFVQKYASLIIVTGLVFGLIILERHLSTLVIGGLTLVGMLIYGGIRKRIILLILSIGIVAGFLILKLGAEYRSDRIETFKKFSLFVKDRPSPTNAAEEYQVRESLTALTRGGLLGTGISHGRAKHHYLPEARTDYVFTIVGEEYGFIGAMIVFILHCLLFFRAFKIAESQENRYTKFLCAGLAMNIFFNALVNTGVAMSILPSTGNTLPFISYGGTALLVDSASVGVIMNISAKRKNL